MWVQGSDGGRVWIEEYSRAEFLAERWQYRPGGHATILVPTGGGKTRFIGELLGYTISPELPVIRFALKPKDTVMTAQCKALGIKIVRDWPPVIMGRPNGWCLWPRHTDDPEADDIRMAEILLRALRWAYRNASRDGRRGIIVDADEMEEIQRLLSIIGKLGIVRGLYRRMRSNGGGMFTGCQAPRYLVTDAYSQCEDLFLGNDPEKRNRERFGEFGGVDPKLVERIVVQLAEFHLLHLRRRGRTMCIIGP